MYDISNGCIINLLLLTGSVFSHIQSTISLYMSHRKRSYSQVCNLYNYIKNGLSNVAGISINIQLQLVSVILLSIV